MGRSAKLHKRVRGNKTPAASTTRPKAAPPPAPSAKKRARLMSKSKARSGAKDTQGDRVLGGADYVTLLLGGRRRAAEEALRLPAE